MCGGAERREGQTLGKSGSDDNHVQIEHLVEGSEGQALALVALHRAAGNSGNSGDSERVALGDANIGAAGDAIPKGFVVVVVQRRLGNGGQSGGGDDVVKGACDPGTARLKPGRSREVNYGGRQNGRDARGSGRNRRWRCRKTDVSLVVRKL
jgi:hypothetical protein